jgi:hypothetical protein
MLNNKNLAKNYLQRHISNKELLQISKKISQEFAPKKPLTSADNSISMPVPQQQLLDVSLNISLYYAPRILSNSNTLALLPIDSEHFYVYWNLADYHQFNHTALKHNEDLKLRVFSQCKGNKPQLVFDTTVSSQQTQQRIGFQKIEKGAIYTASLGRLLSEHNFIALINSNEIYSFYESNNHNGKHKKPQKNSSDKSNIDINLKNESLIQPALISNKPKHNKSGLGIQ